MMDAVVGLDARGFMDGLQVGRLVDVLLPCGVIAVAPPPPPRAHNLHL